MRGVRFVGELVLTLAYGLLFVLLWAFLTV